MIHCWSSRWAGVGAWARRIRQAETILSHVTHLSLFRPLLHNWFRLTLSGIEHIIRKARAALAVNLKPRKFISTYLLMCRTMIPILTSSNLSQPFTILVNSVVGQDISSLRGPVDPALFKKRVIMSNRFGPSTCQSTHVAWP